MLNWQDEEAIWGRSYDNIFLFFKNAFEYINRQNQSIRQELEDFRVAQNNLAEQIQEAAQIFTERNNSIMAQLDDLNTALDGVVAQIQGTAAAVQRELDALQAQIDAGTAAPDLAPSIQRVQALVAQIAAVGAETPTPAPAPAPAPAPTP